MRVAVLLLAALVMTGCSGGMSSGSVDGDAGAWSNQAPAMDRTASRPATRQLAAARFAIPDVPTSAAPRKADRVVVFKERRELVLLDDGYPFRRYRIALGFEPKGHKLREGDGRTPEGSYVLDWRNENSQFHRSIHISYPNPYDVARARQVGYSPGSHIMIHGLPEGEEWRGSSHANQDWTDGCIAVTNEEMDEIWKAVDDGTPIHIYP